MFRVVNLSVNMHMLSLMPTDLIHIAHSAPASFETALYLVCFLLLITETSPAWEDWEDFLLFFFP